MVLASVFIVASAALSAAMVVPPYNTEKTDPPSRLTNTKLAKSATVPAVPVTPGLYITHEATVVPSPMPLAPCTYTVPNEYWLPRNTDLPYLPIIWPSLDRRPLVFVHAYTTTQLKVVDCKGCSYLEATPLPSTFPTRSFKIMHVNETTTAFNYACATPTAEAAVVTDLPSGPTTSIPAPPPLTTEAGDVPASGSIAARGVGTGTANGRPVIQTAWYSVDQDDDTTTGTTSYSPPPITCTFTAVTTITTSTSTMTPVIAVVNTKPTGVLIVTQTVYNTPLPPAGHGTVYVVEQDTGRTKVIVTRVMTPSATTTPSFRDDEAGSNSAFSHINAVIDLPDCFFKACITPEHPHQGGGGPVGGFGGAGNNNGNNGAGPGGEQHTGHSSSTADRVIRTPILKIRNTVPTAPLKSNRAVVKKANNNKNNNNNYQIHKRHIFPPIKPDPTTRKIQTQTVNASTDKLIDGIYYVTSLTTSTSTNTNTNIDIETATETITTTTTLSTSTKTKSLSTTSTTTISNITITTSTSTSTITTPTMSSINTLAVIAQYKSMLSAATAPATTPTSTSTSTSTSTATPAATPTSSFTSTSTSVAHKRSHSIVPTREMEVSAVTITVTSTQVVVAVATGKFETITLKKSVGTREGGVK